MLSIGLTIVPPLALIGIEALVGLASRRAAGYLHASLVALLAGAFFVQVFDRVFDLGGLGDPRGGPHGWSCCGSGLCAT